MQLDIHRKVRSLKFLALREVLLTFGFFICLTVFQTCVIDYIDNGTAADYSWRLVLLFCAIAFCFACRFEIHILAPDEHRFLGYKAYILYFYKWLYLPLSVAVSFFTALYITKNPGLFILSHLIFIVVYYVLLFAFTFRYRKFFKRGKVLVSYLQSAVPWWKEGEFVKSAPVEAEAMPAKAVSSDGKRADKREKTPRAVKKHNKPERARKTKSALPAVPEEKQIEQSDVPETAPDTAANQPATSVDEDNGSQTVPEEEPIEQSDVPETAPDTAADQPATSVDEGNGSNTNGGDEEPR